MPASFGKNDLVKDMIKSAMASDEPAKSKVPLTERQMSALKGSLYVETREGFCLWTGLRFAIAFLCRISEWAVNEKQTLTWRALTFFDSSRQPMEVTCLADVLRVYELAFIFSRTKRTASERGSCAVSLLSLTWQMKGALYETWQLCGCTLNRSRIMLCFPGMTTRTASREHR